MSRPMSTTEILEALLAPIEFNAGLEDFSDRWEVIDTEAEPAWFGTRTPEYPNGDGPDGQAQAIIKINSERYAISLEKLP